MDGFQLEQLFMTVLFPLFIVGIVFAIWDARRRWGRIVTPFRTRIKLDDHDDYDNQLIRIDGRNFKNLVVVPTESGLYISQHGGLSSLIVPGRALIPWTALSPFYTKELGAFGFKVFEHYTDTRSPHGKTQLYIPSNIAKEIIERGFLKSNS